MRVTFILALATNTMTLNFLSSISLGWVMTLLDSHRTDVVPTFWISFLKSSYYFESADTGFRYHKLRKTFWQFCGSYSELLSKVGNILFLEYVSKGISRPVFYGDLVYKLEPKAHWISSRRKHRLLNAFDDNSITRWSSRGL